MQRLLPSYEDDQDNAIFIFILVLCQALYIETQAAARSISGISNPFRH